MFEKKKKPEDMVKISTDEAINVVMNAGYNSKNYVSLIQQWINRYPLLSKKLMGKRLIYKERLQELLETGDIKE